MAAIDPFHNGNGDRDIRVEPAELERLIGELRLANAEVGEARLAALNVMEDAIAARDEADLRGRQYETLLNNAPIGVFVVDSRLRVREVNPVAIPLFDGITEVVGRDLESVFKKIWKAEFSESLLARFRTSLATGKPQHLRETAEKRAGSPKVECYQWRIDRIDMPEGGYGAVCYFRDITEEVLAREAIRESEQRYRQLLSLLPVAVFACDRSGLLTYFNQQAVRFWGRSPIPGDTVKRVFSEETILRPDKRELAYIESPLGSILKDAERFRDEEMALRRMDGSEVVLLFNIDPTFDESGDLSGAIFTFHDITELKAAELSIRESQQHLEMTTQAARVGTWQWVIKDDQVHWSAIHKDLWGLEPTPSPVDFATWRSCIHTADLRRVDAEIQRCLAGEEKYDVEYRINPFDGSDTRWIRSTGTTLYGDSGEAVSMHGISFDISDRKRRETGSALLADVSRVLAQLSDEMEIMRSVGEKVCRGLLVDSCQFSEIDLFADKGTVVFVHGDTGHELPRGDYRISEFFPFGAARRLTSGEAYVVRDVASDRSTARKVERFKGLGIGAFIATPYISDGRWKASLSVASRTSRNWDQEELDLLRDLCSRVWTRIDRVRAERRLRESESRLRALIEHLPGSAVFVVDRQLRFLLAEGESLEAGGMTSGDLLGKTLFDAVPKELANEYALRYREALKGNTFSHEHSFNGIDFETRGAPLRDADGEIYAALAVSYDITSRKSAEKALRHSEEKFRNLFESIDDGFVIVEMIFDDEGRPTDYRFLEANPAFCRHTGLPADALGKTARELVPDLEDFWFEMYGRVATTGQPVRFEHESVPMGRWFDVYALRLGQPSEHRVGILFTNITERRKESADKEFQIEIAEAIRRAESADSLLSDAVHAIGRHMGVSRAFFMEVDIEKGNGEILLDYCTEGQRSLVGPMPMGGFSPDSISILKAGGTLVNNNIRENPRTAEYYEMAYKPLGMEAFVGVPLLRDGKWVSLLAVVQDAPREWTSAEVPLLETVAERVWLAVERARNEERIKESEELFSKAFKASPLVLTISSLTDGRLLEVNDTFVDVTGYSREEAIGKTTLELGVWADPAEREAELGVIRDAGQLSNAEYLFRTRDGREIVGLLSAERVDIKGEPCALTVIQDITERKRSESALRESEHRFRATSDAAPVLIWMADTKQDRYWFNKPWLEFTGRTIEAEAGRAWIEGVFPDDRERVARIFDDAFVKRETFNIEFRLRRSDGAYRWVMDKGVPRSSPTGEFLGYIGSCIDIHDRREMESALRQSEARLQLATRVGNYGTWDINYVEDRMIWSDKLFDLFGLTPAPDHQMPLAAFADLALPDEAELVRSLISPAKGQKHVSAEFRIKRADNGETRWLSTAAQIFADGSGKAVRSVGIVQDVTDRKVAEDTIRASEERFKLAQEAGNVGIWDWNIDADRTFWSDQMWRFYGYDRLDVNPDDRFWSDHLHPEDRERVKKAMGDALHSAASQFEDEFRIVRADREIRWIEVRATIVRNDAGAPTRMYGVNLDISEKKEIAEKIRSSEAQLRVITDTIPALVSYIDRNERYRFVNRQYTEWFGVSADQILGRSMLDVLGEAAYRSLKPQIEAVVRGERISFSKWLNYKGAGFRYVHVSYVPDFAPDGTVAGYYALVSDLTEQKRSEERLQSSEDKMRLLSESFTDYAIIAMDPQGRIESWNPGATNIFGYTDQEAIGEDSAILFTPEDIARKVPEKERSNALRSGRAVDERWHVRKDGTRFYASGVTAPLYVGDALAGYAKIAADLTERKRNAEALQRAYDEMEMRVLDRTRELAAVNESLVREINERKTAERQKIDLLKRLVSSQEGERKRIARDLHDHLGQRLTALRLKLAALREASEPHEELVQRTARLQQIAETLDSEVSFLAWELRPTALDELGLLDAIETFAKEWSRHYDVNAEFHSSGVGNLRFDRETETHLYRITQEALNNIAKHAEASSVSVIIEKRGKYILLIVEDDGKGFRAEDGETSRRAEGGLGLPGMKERAELIGGQLEIESEPGRGTTVFVKLPHTASIEGGTNE